jgi:hypothetical protein
MNIIFDLTSTSEHNNKVSEHRRSTQQSHPGTYATERSYALHRKYPRLPSILAEHPTPYPSMQKPHISPANYPNDFIIPSPRATTDGFEILHNALTLQAMERNDGLDAG